MRDYDSFNSVQVASALHGLTIAEDHWSALRQLYDAGYAGLPYTRDERGIIRGETVFSCSKVGRALMRALGTSDGDGMMWVGQFDERSSRWRMEDRFQQAIDLLGWFREPGDLTTTVTSSSISRPTSMTDLNGHLICATFGVERIHAGRYDLLVHVGNGRGANPQYTRVLKRLLEHLGVYDGTVHDAAIDWDGVDLPIEQRRLSLRSFSYPIELRLADAARLRKELASAQTRTARELRERGAENRTRRFRLTLSLANESWDAQSLADVLAGMNRPFLYAETNARRSLKNRATKPTATRTQLAIDRLADELAKRGSFTAGSDEDARARTQRSIAERRGQPTFREELLIAYEGRCAITDCDVESVLEAAHIQPYRGDHTNHVQNGLLLRADVHTLFDSNLIAIEPETLVVRIDSSLRGSEYERYDGKQLRRAAHPSMQPSRDALRAQWECAASPNATLERSCSSTGNEPNRRR